MDRSVFAVDEQNLPLVMLEFLQGGCKSNDYNTALQTIRNNLSKSSPVINCDEDGEIECDGHMPSMPLDLAGIEPDVNLNVNRADAAVHQVAAELRQIAARLEHGVVAEATRNLQRRVKSSPYEQWTEHLRREVDGAIVRGVCLQDLPQERVIMAVSLTLVKGVCELAPNMVHSLFDAALNFISGRRRTP